MKRRIYKRLVLKEPREQAFTLIELLVILTIIAMLAATLLPALASAKGNSQKMACFNNLKQIGLAFRTWEGSHNDRYPMAVSYTSGGAEEWVAHCDTAVVASTCMSFCPGLAFMVMSNELSTPKTLFCPSDNIHQVNNGYATNFSDQDLLGILVPPVGARPNTQVGENPGGYDSKISYFINGDVSEANPQDIMTGDDNIGTAGTAVTGVAPYRFGSAAGQTTVASADQATCQPISALAYGPTAYWAWTANDFHQKSGNLGMVDGSCQWTTISSLHYYLSQSTNSAPYEAINFMP